MDGLQFISTSPAARTSPVRADVACFAGFVACRRPGSAALRDSLDAAFRPPLNTRATERFRSIASAIAPESVVEWWIENNWLPPHSARAASDFADLLDLPVPLDNWDIFDLLFAWDQRPLSSSSTRLANTLLGAAVRRFFAQGGRRCYVVRVGDPWPALGTISERGAAVRRLLNDVPPPTPVDRRTWRGAAHIFGLPDVSFLNMPDLPDVFAVNVSPVVRESEPQSTEERFIECGAETLAPEFRNLRAFPPPRCDESGFRGWTTFVNRTANLLQRYAREVQFVGAVPLPVESDFHARRSLWQDLTNIETAFVQLGFPWLSTRESGLLPGALEPPDAMLTGMLANSALTAGAWRTAAGTAMPEVAGVEPALSKAEIKASRDRISLFGETAQGFQLLSDVTTDDDPVYRRAEVNRLVAWIVRACRLEGEAATFANSGEALWRRVTASLTDLLITLWGEGALAGSRSSDAFEVRCDRTTMSQNDLDSGRVIARVQFSTSTSIDQIVVLLAMDEGGQETLTQIRSGGLAGAGV